jgi:beta-lactamase regulating signal transducer with metallopeptidase domain
MVTKLITSLIPNDIAKAIAWTLIHSFWIGLLFAAVAGIIVTFSKKSSSRLRYHLLCATLIAFVLVMTFTLFHELRTNSGITAVAATTFGPIRSIVQQSDMVRQLIALLNQQSAIIFLIWVIFFVLKSIRLTGGMLYIHKIRTRNTIAVPAEWQKKLKEFCTKISISRPVTLLQSELVSVPVAIGWLKPVILVPVGMFCQLSPEQVETILLHELAHISRQDYLVNIMQGIVEAVFFFNPALLWLSSLIKQEREACCDDMVLAHISRKSDYLEALLAIGSSTANVNLAMSLSSGSNQLKNRLKRMIYLENQKLSFREVFSLLLGIIFITAFTVLPKAQASIQRHISAAAVKADYLKVTDYNSQLRKTAKRSITQHKKKLTEQEANGMKMYGQALVNYQDMLTQIDQSMQGPAKMNAAGHTQAVKDTAFIKQHNPQIMHADSLSSNSSLAGGKKTNHPSELFAKNTITLKGIIDEAKKRVE